MTKVYVDKQLLSELSDNMILEYKDDKEFCEAMAWLDKTKFIKGDFYDKVIQLLFFSGVIKKDGMHLSDQRMKDFMKSLMRKEK